MGTEIASIPEPQDSQPVAVIETDLQPAPLELPELRPSALDAARIAEKGTEATRQARIWDINDFSRFLGCDPVDACARLASGSKGQTRAILNAYQRHQVDRGLAAVTVNRRLCTLHKVIELASQLDIIEWVVKVKGLEVQALRDTRGPGHAGWVRVRAQAAKAAARSNVGIRNLAILRLLHDSALRCNEVLSLDLEHWDADAGRVMVKRKGHTDRIPITINTPTILAVSHWIKVRGEAAGPLFCRLDRARPKDKHGFYGAPVRISGKAARRLTKKLGETAGLNRTLRPHALRHEAITRALDLEGGNVERVRRFAGHKDVNTTIIYNDNRDDVAGAIAERLGEDD